MANAAAGSHDPVQIEDVVAGRVARLSAGQLDCLLLVDQHLSSKEIATFALATLYLQYDDTSYRTGCQPTSGNHRPEQPGVRGANLSTFTTTLMGRTISLTRRMLDRPLHQTPGHTARRYGNSIRRFLPF